MSMVLDCIIAGLVIAILIYVIYYISKDKFHVDNSCPDDDTIKKYYKHHWRNTAGQSRRFIADCSITGILIKRHVNPYYCDVSYMWRSINNISIVGSLNSEGIGNRRFSYHPVTRQILSMGAPGTGVTAY